MKMIKNYMCLREVFWNPWVITLAKQKAAGNAELTKGRRLQDALLSIKKQFGKNTVLKAMSLQEGATAKDRNQ